MSKHTKHQFQQNSHHAILSGSAQKQHRTIIRDAQFWAPFETYNKLETSKRADALQQMGIRTNDSAVKGILTKSHFVIPGKTMFECKRCGECCRYARKIAQLTYDPCPFLTSNNDCAKHDDRYLVCKWFPFWILHDPVYGDLLTIKPYCTGYGSGLPVEYTKTLERITQLAISEEQNKDGAFVIHEVLNIPGRKDWVFPSKKNVDELMTHIMMEAKTTNVTKSSDRPLDRSGEVHYAHHYTSGLLGSIQSPLCTVNESGVITDVNLTVEELLKRQRSEIIGKLFKSYFVNADSVAVNVSNCLSRGKETAAPQRLRMPDESAVPVLLNALVYRDRSDGLVHGSLICINPVSAAVFNEVSQSRSYARGLLEASIDSLLVIDKDGIITDVNEAVVTISGFAREKLLGSSFKELFTNKEKAQTGVENTFRTGKVQNYDLILSTQSQEQIPVSFNATVFYDSEGVVQGIFASARDIRNRLKLVHELEEAKNYARGLIDCCIDLMVTINRNGIITDVNTAAVTMTGRKKEELIGAQFKDFFDDPVRAQKGVDSTFTNKEVRNYEMNLLTVADKKIPVSFNANLYCDSKGNVLGVFAIARAKYR